MQEAVAVDARHERWLAYAASAVAAGFAGAMLAATSGHFVPQIADLYLVCQYARAFAEGHPFQYNAGEAPSTGATSLLLTIVLGLAHAAGIRGEGLVAFAIIMGAVLFVITVRLAFRLGARLASPRESILAGVLVLTSGPVVWGFLYGSDIAWFMALFMWLTERLVAGSLQGTVIAATLLALARPEGLPIAAFLMVASRRLWPAEPHTRWLALPVAAGSTVLLLYRALTGSWVSTSVSDKSLLANYGAADGIALVTEYLVDVVRGLLLGLYPAHTPIGFAKGWASFYFPPLALLLAILAVATFEARRRDAALVWASLVALVALLVTPSLFMGVHFHRYLLWAFPTLHVFVAVGLAALTRRLAGEDDALEKRLFAGGVALMAGLGILSTARFAALYGEMAGEIHRRDVAAAQWILRHLPSGVPIANLATSVEYLTGHRNLNLHGVTSPAFFGGRTAEREMNTFEALRRLRPEERPEYLLTTVSQHQAFATMSELVAEPPLFQTTSFGDEIVLYRMSYASMSASREPLAPTTLERLRGLTLVDQLNVGDSHDEQAHAYRFSSALHDIRLHGMVRAALYEGSAERLLDGGRAILGRESFVVRARRGRDLVVVLRTTRRPQVQILRASGSGVFELDLSDSDFSLWVQRKPYRKVGFRPATGWDEQVFVVEGAALGETETSLELQGRYASFAYWFFQ